MMEKLRTGGWDGCTPQPETIEGMVCPECKAECRKLREVVEQQRVEAHRQEQMEEEKRRDMVAAAHKARVLRYEWRTAAAKEVDPKPHSAEFRAIFAADLVFEILFRWRAAPGKCRGKSYLMKVGIWVNGKLNAHYYGWNLQDFDDDVFHENGDGFWFSEDKWPTSDLFGRGFCRWVERAFQHRLVRVEPDRICGPGRLLDLDETVIHNRPCTHRIAWFDGSRYVHLLPALNLPEVAEWAEKHLELRIEERAFRPVRRADRAGE